jgi:AraC-like DNA-binding protein
LLCGAYTLDSLLSDALLAPLPPLVVLRDAGLDRIVALLAEELATPGPGEQTVLDRALDLLLVLGLRAWFTRPEATVPGWYAALDDPGAGPAVRAIHADPRHRWTVAELAAEAGLSRAAFAKRFTDVVGEVPAGLPDRLAHGAPRPGPERTRRHHRRGGGGGRLHERVRVRRRLPPPLRRTPGPLARRSSPRPPAVSARLKRSVASGSGSTRRRSRSSPLPE